MADTNVIESHEEAIRVMLAEFRTRVAGRLPLLENVTTVELRRLVSAASVPDEFLEQIAGTIDNSPVVGVANEITAAEPRDVIEFSRVYFTLADGLEQLSRDVRAVVLKVRHDVGQRALGVYGTVKSINRSNRKQLVSNTTALSRALGRTRRKAKPAKTPPADGNNTA